MELRKTLLKIKLWAKLATARRKLRRLARSLIVLQKAHEKELLAARSHYERLLAEERLKVETLALKVADTACQARNLPSVSYSVSDLSERAERIVDPAYQPPDPAPEDALLGDEHDLFLDLRDGFWEAERQSGRDDAEIKRLWEETFKLKAVRQAKELIIQ